MTLESFTATVALIEPIGAESHVHLRWNGKPLVAYAGNRFQDRRADDNQSDLDKSRCRVVGASGTDAFDVRYTWQGREYVARMDHDPGRYLELGRDVNSDGTPY